MQKMCYTNCKLYDSMRKREENSMVTAVRSLGLQGISGYEVTVECFLSGGLPAFDIVGLGDTAVKESRERVRAAVKNCGVKFPVSRITVNLAPAGRKKEGTLYDLPILLGILASAEEIKPPAKDAAFVGELSLTGTLRAVNGVLPMAMAAVRAGIRTLYVPAANAAEATLAVKRRRSRRARPAPTFPTSWDRKMSSARWRSPLRADTISCSSARPARANPCWRGGFRRSCPT